MNLRGPPVSDPPPPRTGITGIDYHIKLFNVVSQDNSDPYILMTEPSPWSCSLIFFFDTLV